MACLPTYQGVRYKSLKDLINVIERQNGNENITIDRIEYEFQLKHEEQLNFALQVLSHFSINEINALGEYVVLKIKSIVDDKIIGVTEYDDYGNEMTTEGSLKFAILHEIDLNQHKLNEQKERANKEQVAILKTRIDQLESRLSRLNDDKTKYLALLDNNKFDSELLRYDASKLWKVVANLLMEDEEFELNVISKLADKNINSQDYLRYVTYFMDALSSIMRNIIGFNFNLREDYTTVPSICKLKEQELSNGYNNEDVDPEATDELFEDEDLEEVSETEDEQIVGGEGWENSLTTDFAKSITPIVKSILSQIRNEKGGYYNQSYIYNSLITNASKMNKSSDFVYLDNNYNYVFPLFEKMESSYPWVKLIIQKLLNEPSLIGLFYFNLRMDRVNYASYTNDGNLVFLNRDMNEQSALDELYNNYSMGNIIGRESIYNKDKSINVTNANNIKRVIDLILSDIKSRKNNYDFLFDSGVNNSKPLSIYEYLSYSLKNIGFNTTPKALLKVIELQAYSVKYKYKDAIYTEEELRDQNITPDNKNVTAVREFDYYYRYNNKLYTESELPQGVSIDSDEVTKASLNDPFIRYNDEILTESEFDEYKLNGLLQGTSEYLPSIRLDKEQTIKRICSLLDNIKSVCILASTLKINTVGNDGFNDSSFFDICKHNLSEIAKVIGTCTIGTFSPSLYINGKTYYGYSVPNYLNKVSKLLKDEEKASDFIESEFGQDEFFYYYDQNGVKKYFCDWLNDSKNDSVARQYSFNTKYVVSLYGSEDEVIAYADFDKEIFKRMWLTDFLYQKNYAYYLMPIFSDSPACVQMLGKVYKTDDCLNHLTDLALLEILAIKRNEEINNKKKGYYFALYSLNRSKFTFLIELNNIKDNETLNKLKGKSKDYILDILKNRENNDYRDIKNLIQLIFKAKRDSFRDALFANDELKYVTNKYKLKYELLNRLDNGDPWTNFDDFLMNYVVNSEYARNCMILIYTGDPAWYMDSVDFQKRWKQIVSGGHKLCTSLANFDPLEITGKNIKLNINKYIVPNEEDKKKKKYSSLENFSENFHVTLDASKERTIYINDKFIYSSLVGYLKNYVLGNLLGLANREPDDNRKKLYNLMINEIRGFYDQYKRINATDAQAFRTAESYQRIMDMTGLLSELFKKTFDNFKNGKWSIFDFYTIWQTLKPFVFTNINRDLGDGLGTLRVPHLNKNSELILLNDLAVMMSSKFDNPVLNGLNKFMQDFHIDVIQFNTSAKVGRQASQFGLLEFNYSHIKAFEFFKQGSINYGNNKKFSIDNSIDVQENKYVEEVREQIQVALENNKISLQDYSLIMDLLTMSEEEVYSTLFRFAIKDDVDFSQDELDNEDIFNHEVVNELPYEDYCILQPTDEHIIDKTALFGTQARYIIPASLPDGTYIINKDINDLETEIAKDDMLYLYFTSLVLNVYDGFKLVKNRLQSNTKESLLRLRDLILDGCSGKPDIKYDLKNALEIKEVNGGYQFKTPLSSPIIKTNVIAILNAFIRKNITNLVIKGGNIIQASSYGIDDKLHGVYSEDGSLIGIECLLPATSKKMYEQFITYDSNNNAILDYNRLPEDMRRIIGYRIPTEEKYSILPLYIKGFLPLTSASCIKVAPEITLFTGGDFDVDKLFMMLPSFKTKRKFKKNITETFIIKEFIDSNYSNVLNEDKRLIPLEKIFDELLGQYQKHLVEFVKEQILKGNEENGTDLEYEELTYNDILKDEDTYYKYVAMYNKKHDKPYSLKGLARMVSKEDLNNIIMSYNEFVNSNALDYYDYSIKKNRFDYKKYLSLQNQRLKFDYLLKQPKSVRDNILIDIFGAVLTDIKVADLFFLPGGYLYIKDSVLENRVLNNLDEILKANIINLETNLAYTREELIKHVLENQLMIINNKAIKDFFRGQDSPLSDLTFLKFHSQNMDGKKLVASLAVQNTIHAKYQHNPATLKPNYLFKVKNFDGNEICTIKDIDLVYDMFGLKRSKSIGLCLAAAVDNGKDPLLTLIGLNIKNILFITTSARIGIPFRISSKLYNLGSYVKEYLLSNKDVISKFLKENNTQIETDTTLDLRLIETIHKYRSESLSKLSDEEKAEFIKALIGINKVLSIIQDIQKDLKVISDISRGETKNGSLSFDNTLNLEFKIKYQIAKEMFKADAFCFNFDKQEFFNDDYNKEDITDNDVFKMSNHPLAYLVAATDLGIIVPTKSQSYKSEFTNNEYYFQKVMDLVLSQNGNLLKSNAIKEINQYFSKFLNSKCKLFGKDQEEYFALMNYYNNYFANEYAGKVKDINIPELKRVRIKNGRILFDNIAKKDKAAILLMKLNFEKLISGSFTDDAIKAEAARNVGLDLFRYSYFVENLLFGRSNVFNLFTTKFTDLLPEFDLLYREYENNITEEEIDLFFELLELNNVIPANRVTMNFMNKKTTKVYIDGNGTVTEDLASTREEPNGICISVNDIESVKRKLAMSGANDEKQFCTYLKQKPSRYEHDEYSDDVERPLYKFDHLDLENLKIYYKRVDNIRKLSSLYVRNYNKDNMYAFKKAKTPVMFYNNTDLDVDNMKLLSQRMLLVMMKESIDYVNNNIEYKIVSQLDYADYLEEKQKQRREASKHKQEDEEDNNNTTLFLIDEKIFDNVNYDEDDSEELIFEEFYSDMYRTDKQIKSNFEENSSIPESILKFIEDGLKNSNDKPC